MIKIYGSLASSAGRCFWTLEEVGTPYEVINVDLRAGEQKTPEYLALNPNGKVPTLVDKDFVLFESYAIDWYLVSAYKPEMLGSSVHNQALVHQWSFWSVFHVQKYFDIWMYFQLFQVGTAEVVEKAKEDVKKYMLILENHLDGKEYLVQEQFTLADLHVASAVNIGVGLGYDMSPYPRVSAWLTKLKSRPAYVKLLEKKA